MLRDSRQALMMMVGMTLDLPKSYQTSRVGMQQFRSLALSGS